MDNLKSSSPHSSGNENPNPKAPKADHICTWQSCTKSYHTKEALKRHLRVHAFKECRKGMLSDEEVKSESVRIITVSVRENFAQKSFIMEHLIVLGRLLLDALEKSTGKCSLFLDRMGLSVCNALKDRHKFETEEELFVSAWQTFGFPDDLELSIARVLEETVCIPVSISSKKVENFVRFLLLDVVKETTCWCSKILNERFEEKFLEIISSL